MSCDDAGRYLESAWTRQQEEAKTVFELTGWKLDDVKKRMGLTDTPPQTGKKKWHEEIWKQRLCGAPPRRTHAPGSDATGAAQRSVPTTAAASLAPRS